MFVFYSLELRAAVTRMRFNLAVELNPFIDVHVQAMFISFFSLTLSKSLHAGGVSD